MKKKKRLASTKGLKLSKNKVYFGLFLTVLSVALLLQATYAWTSFARWRYNHMQGEVEVEVPKIIVEGYLDGVVLGPGQSKQRDIVVTNLTKRPVFIRVKVSEILALLEVDVTDQTGNGHLAEYDSLEGNKRLMLDVPGSWQVGNYYQKLNQTTFYKVDSVQSYSHVLSQVGRPPEMAPITLGWATIDPKPPVSTGYWMYQELKGTGYFYYSDLVGEGESTTVLIKDLTIRTNLANAYKGALYRLDVQAEAGEATEGVYGSWSIPEVPGTPVYDRFKQLLSST